MVSEALAQGKPVVSFLTKKGSVLSKHERFLEGLRRKGEVACVESHEVGRTVGEILKNDRVSRGEQGLEGVSKGKPLPTPPYPCQPLLTPGPALDPVVEFLVKWL